MKTKKQALQGKYICEKSERELAKYQLVRTLLCLVSSALLIFPTLFIEQVYTEYLLKNNNQSSLLRMVLLLFFVVVCFSLYRLIVCQTTYRFKKEIPKSKMPKRDYTKHTYLVIELSFYLEIIFTVVQIVLTIYKFSLGSLILCFTLIISDVATLFVWRISLQTYATSLTFVSNEQNTNDFLANDKPSVPPSDNEEQTNLPKLKNIDNNIDDFYNS